MDNIDAIRELLEKDNIHMSEDEIQTTVSQLQYLVDIWLDDVEKQIFEGKTLEELLTGMDL